MSADIEDIQKNVDAALAEEPTEPTEPVEPAEPAEPQEPEFTETELEAKDHGWNPDGKDRDGNTLSADEFLARKPLFNKIHNLQDKLEDKDRQIGEINKRVDTLVDHNKKIAESKVKERKDLLEQLAEAKDDALESLDKERVRAIDKEMENVRTEINEAVVPDFEPVEQRVSPDFADFAKDNEWANDKESALYSAAEVMAKNYGAANQGREITDKELYDHIHKGIRELYPHKFKETKQPKIGRNQQRTPIEQPKKGHSIDDLPEDQRSIANEVMEATGMTIDDYFKTYQG